MTTEGGQADVFISRPEPSWRRSKSSRSKLFIRKSNTHGSWTPALPLFIQVGIHLFAGQGLMTADPLALANGGHDFLVGLSRLRRKGLQD